MIHFKLYDNPLVLDDLNLESSLSALTPQERAKIESVRVLQVEEKAHFQRDLISVFRDFLAFCGLKPSKIYWKNWLKLVAALVKPGSKLCSLQDLNGTEHLRVFHHKDDAEWAHDLERFISQALAAGPVFQD